jgi:hypothetical protein
MKSINPSALVQTKISAYDLCSLPILSATEKAWSQSKVTGPREHSSGFQTQTSIGTGKQLKMAFFGSLALLEKGKL